MAKGEHMGSCSWAALLDPFKYISILLLLDPQSGLDLETENQTKFNISLFLQATSTKCL